MNNSKKKMKKKLKFKALKFLTYLQNKLMKPTIQMNQNKRTNILEVIENKQIINYLKYPYNIFV